MTKTPISSLDRFATLIQREWLQHRLGWLIMLAAPLLITSVAAVFGTISVDLGADDAKVERVPEALTLAFGSIAALAALTMFLACLFVLFQAPGLARRDQQDRSIEFWLSLPTGHVPSLGATLLTHLLLVPWLALAVGTAGGLLLSLLAVGKVWSVGAWFALPWGSLLAAAVVLMLRLAAGLMLAMLWLSPLILMTMAASAWLKRWGVPLVAAVLGGGGLLLDKVYQQPIVWEVLGTLAGNASRALIVAERGSRGLVLENDSQVLPFLRDLPAWALKDLGAALQALASPAFVAALVVAGLGFALLVLRRQRGS